VIVAENMVFFSLVNHHPQSGCNGRRVGNPRESSGWNWLERQGVHVFLDMHQDAFSTTNGGEGIPYWVAADFQADFCPWDVGMIFRTP
jgi:hypothetical protein